MICRRCHVVMKSGYAMQSTVIVGAPDFASDVDKKLGGPFIDSQSALRGQTMSPGGPGTLVKVLKCPQCGHSVKLGETYG